MDESARDDARRRRYQIRRSQVRAAVKRGPRLETSAMTDSALWAVLLEELDGAEQRAAGSMSAEVYISARKAREVAQELKMRGTQLGLGL